MYTLLQHYLTYSRRHLTNILGAAPQLLNRMRSVLMGAVSLLMVCAAGPSLVLAQQASDSSTIKSSELRVASLEQSYDRQVINTLSSYFDRQKFLVDVNITTEMIEETYTTRQNKVTQRPSSDVVMPGLPFLPDKNRRSGEMNETPETIINENTVRNMVLKSIIVNIQADSSFNDEELAFMRKIAGIAAKTNTMRGDIVNITQISMPDFTAPKPENTVQATNESSGFLGFSISFSQFLSVVMVLLFIALIIYVSRLNHNTDQEKTTKRRALFSGDYNGKPDEGTLPSGQLNGASKQHNNESAFTKLIDHFLASPREVALIFESWAEEDPQEGITNAAKVVNSVDRQLIKSLKDGLNEQQYDAIKQAVEELPLQSLDQKKETARTFNALLESKNGSSRSSVRRNQVPLFKFLDHITQGQTLQLINEEEPQAAALILDYLTDQQAAKLLDQLDEEQTSSIMMEMMRLQELSYSKQKEISGRLFDKAMQMKESTDNNRFNSSNILPILEQLPLGQQRRYIDQLTSTNPAIGTYLDEHFITVDQIPGLDEKLIKSATVQINTDTLLDAVTGLDEAVVDKLLSVRPQREQRLIRDELQQRSPQNIDTEHETSIVLNAIRQTVRNRKN